MHAMLDSAENRVIISKPLLAGIIWINQNLDLGYA